MISNRIYCGLTKGTTVLPGGVCRRTSIAHKSGNTMKRRRKKNVYERENIFRERTNT